MPKTQRSAPASYDVHPAVGHAQAMVANLPEKSGKSLAAWLALLAKNELSDPKAATAWLRREHGLGVGTAILIGAQLDPEEQVRTDDAVYLAAAPGYVEAQYTGPRAALRPLFEALLAAGRSLGTDVRVCPCKTMVPLYRNHVFAELKATTRARIDLGLALKGATRKLPARLIATGGLAKGDRITHRIPLTSPAELDAEVRGWLAAAYQLDR